MPTVHLIHGFIGSGKTTFARKLEAETAAVRLSPDEMMTARYGIDPPAKKFKGYFRAIMRELDRTWPDLVRQGRDVILDFGFWSRKQRDRFREKIKKLGAIAILYDVRCDESTAKERVQARNRDPAGSLYIADSTYAILKKKFEPLEKDEVFVPLP